MSSSLPTEMTIRNFLTKALEQRSIKVQTEWSYNTPIGRLVPDMLLRNGAEYVVETKLGAESKLLDAIVQLYDYSKYTQAKGAFAIKVLTEAVDSMTLSLRSLKTQDIEEIFGGKTVFENILQYEEGHYPLDEMRQAATYLLVNQIIFYHVLSAANPQ